MRNTLTIIALIFGAITFTSGAASATPKTQTVVNDNTLNGQPVTVNGGDYKTISGKISGPAKQREIWVQRYNPTAKTWPIQTIVKTTGNYSIPINKNWPNAQYRIHIPATTGGTSFTGKPTQITQNFNNVKMVGTKTTYAHAIVPWNQNQISTRVTLGTAKVTAQLQKRNGTTGNSWTTIEARKNVGNGLITFNIPKGNTSTKNSTTQWRILLPESLWFKQTGTAYMTHAVENPNHYTGSAKTIYNYYKQYCPNMLMKFTKFPNSNTWGMANLGISHYIHIGTTVPAKHYKTVALHECAHFRQWAIYGYTLMSEASPKMNKAHNTTGTRGLEINADCIANLWSKSTYWSYDKTGNCSGTRHTAASALANNRKY